MVSLSFVYFFDDSSSLGAGMGPYVSESHNNLCYPLDGYKVATLNDFLLSKQVFENYLDSLTSKNKQQTE